MNNTGKREMLEMEPTVIAIPNRKSVSFGVFVAVFGLCALSLAIVINPILQDNKDTLEVKEFLGTYTSGDHQAVAIQTVAVLFGFIAGAPFTLLGIVLIVLTLNHNSRSDAMKQGQERSQSGDTEPTPARERSFCGYCGEPIEGKPYCVHCGKRT